MSDVLTPKAPAQERVPVRGRDPLASMRQDFNRMLETFWRGAPLSGLDWPQTGTTGWAAPAVEFSESEKAYTISAELPGLDKSDIELAVQDNMLILSGEKRSDIDEKRENVHLSERRYGAFQRAFSLPSDVDTSKVEAKFNNGILEIALPKDAAQRSTQTIKVE